MDDDLDQFDRPALIAEVADFLRGCVRYRESLQRELPAAPVADAESE
jgi:hypothetical protein